MATLISSLYAKISADTSDFDRGLRNSHDALSRMEGGINKVVKAGAMLGAVGVAAVAGVAWQFVEGLKDVAAFEQGVTNIKAILQLTDEQAVTLGKTVSAIALDPNLVASADEALAAYEMLAKGGLTYDQVQQGALKNTILLANATGEQLPAAAEIMVKTMMAWNMKGEESAHVANLLTGALNASTWTLSDLNVFMGQSQGAAQRLNISWEDLMTTGVGMSSSFSGGSSAGTSLNNMFIRLSPQTQEAADMMRTLGLMTGLTTEEYTKAEEELGKVEAKIAALDPTSKTYEEQLGKLQTQQANLNSTLQVGKVAFFDLEGNAKNMNEIGLILANSMANLTAVEKQNALNKMFLVDGSAAAYEIMKMATDGTYASAAATLASTDANAQAAIMTDTLSAKWKNLIDTIIEFRKQIVAKFEPAARMIVEWAKTMLDKYQPAIMAFFSDVAAKAVATVKTFIENWPLILKGIQEFGKIVADLLPKGEALFKKFSAYFTSTDSKRPLEWLVRFMASGAVTFQVFGDMIKGTIDGFKLLGEAVQALTKLDFAKVGELSGKAWDAFSGAGMSGKEMDDAVEAIMRRVYGGTPAPAMLTTGTSASSGSTVNINGNIILQGTGNNANDLTSAVRFTNALYGAGA